MDGKKWYTCHLCGGSYNQVEIPFSSGTIVPTEGETLTGATSGHTTVTDNVKLISGDWDAGTASGIIWGLSPIGFDFDTGHWGSANEVITGDRSASFTLVGYGYKKSYGRYYSEDEVIERDGVTLCLFHNRTRYSFKDKNEQSVEIDEGDRNE